VHLKQIQQDEAELGAIADEGNLMADKDIKPAYLRGRARHYRELAEKAADPYQATLYLELAKAFDKEAAAKDKLDKKAEAKDKLD
jgi:hypothetical protein